MRLAHLEIQGRRNAVAHFNHGLWRKVSVPDQRQIQEIITDTGYGAQGVDGRSLLYALQNPIQVRNAVILSLRFKGVAPDVKPDGRIPEHRGGGYVAHPHLVKEDGTAYRKESNRGSPEGGLLEKGAKVEFSTAKVVGPKLTDFAFGHGVYPELEYHGERPGFVIFGMETEADLRFWKSFIQPRLDTLRYHEGSPYSHLIGKDRLALAKLFGEALAKFHKSFIHCFPHLGNIGVIDQDGKPIQVRIRDLTDCLAIDTLTPEQAYGYLVLDLARVFDEFCGNHKADDGEHFIDINLADLLPSFLEAYFEDCPSFPITSGVNWRLEYRFDISEADQTVHFLRYLGEQIRDGAQKFNLPQVLSENPLSFIAFMHQHFSTFAGLG